MSDVDERPRQTPHPAARQPHGRCLPHRSVIDLLSPVPLWAYDHG